MPRLAKRDKESLDATREEAVKWLSEQDAERHRKDVEKLNRPSKQAWRNDPDYFDLGEYLSQHIIKR